jgi:RHS repeat-associated protein
LTNSSACREVIRHLRFAGQYFDEETELHYNFYRTYDPTIGRYISADPIGQNGGHNVFLYARNKPTRLIDPRGEFALPAVLAPLAPYLAGFGKACLYLGTASAGALGIDFGIQKMSEAGGEDGEEDEKTPPPSVPDDVQDALDQLDDITAAQEADRQGKRDPDKPIDFIEKSKQRAKDALRRIRSTKDLK